MNISECKVIVFAPDKWGTLEHFRYFYTPTYTFNPDTQKALSGAVNHFHKAYTILRVAHQHTAKLAEDRDQLQERGYTPAQRGKELSALIESVFLDLYSSIDCARKVVTFIYRNHRGVKQSTRKFFQAVANGTVDVTVPKEIRNAFANAHWYVDFRRIRDALTHSDIGSCHLDEKSGKVFYMHAGLGIKGKALIIEDVFAHIEELIGHINQFIGEVFLYLNGTLEDDEVWQACGMFGGRLYSRWVRPSEAKDFNSGRCDAFKWFEMEENPNCPFMNTCEAYRRKVNDRVGTVSDNETLT